MFGIRRITEEEARQINYEKDATAERCQALKVLLNLKPGVFDPEDQAKAAEH